MKKIEVKTYPQNVIQEDGSLKNVPYTTIDLLRTVLFGVKGLKTDEVMFMHSLMDRFNEFGTKTGKKSADNFLQLSEKEFEMLHKWIDQHIWMGYAPGVVELIATFKKR